MGASAKASEVGARLVKKRLVGAVKRASDLLWGGLSVEELERYGVLALGFFLLVGSYWPLKTLKDDLLIAMIGNKYQAVGKLLSVLALGIAVSLYSRFLSGSRRSRSVYILSMISGTLGLILASVLSGDVSAHGMADRGPHRLIGWAFFVFVETYMSLILATYWAFVNDINTERDAKKGYGILIAGAQGGALVMLLLTRAFGVRGVSAVSANAPIVIIFSSIAIYLVGLLAVYAERRFGKSAEKEGGGKQTKFEKVSFFGGLKAVFSYRYAFAIFSVVFVSEMLVSVIHHQLMFWVEWYRMATGLGAGLMFTNGILIQVVSTTLSLFGTSAIQRKLGLRGAFLWYAIATVVSLIPMLIWPSVWTMMGAMVASRGAAFALHSPSKEVLYIPADENVRHRAKAWIDTFGVRIGKFVGVSVSSLVGFARTGGAVTAIVLAVIYMAVSTMASKRHDELLRERRST